MWNCQAVTLTSEAVECRIANVGSNTPIALGEVNLQYWFNGPDGVAQFEKAAPSQLFQLKCSDATTGQLCNNIVFFSLLQRHLNNGFAQTFLCGG